MEKVLTTNNGQANWVKLDTFGLSSRRSFIGWNRYQGSNSCVTRIDSATGMRVMLIPASIPRSERVLKADRVKGKRGRPAVQGPIMFREPGKIGRPCFIGPIEKLVFYSHPQQKRGPKPMTAEMKAQKAIERAQNTAVSAEPTKKRGRMSNADKLKAALPGQIVKEKGGYWLKMNCGLATWVNAA